MIPGAVPWPKEWEEKYLRDCWPNKNFGQVFLESVAKNATRIALVEGDRRVTFCDLGEKVKGLACGLMQLGLKPADRVLLQLPNSLEFFYAYWACQLAGLISVMCLPPHRDRELIYLAGLTEAAAYFIPDSQRGHDYQQMAKDIQVHCPALKHIIVRGQAQEGNRSLDKLIGTEVPGDWRWPQPDPREVAVLQLSGGTTGVSKVIPRTHNDYIYNTTAQNIRLEFAHDEVFLAPMPFAHNACIHHMVHPALFRGGTAVVCAHEPEAISRAIEKERVTHIFLVPTLFYRWLEFADFERYDYSSLRLSATGAQKMHASQAARIDGKLPGVFLQVFGMSEGVVMAPAPDDPEWVRYESVGKPVSPWDEIRVVDEEGREVGPGEMGEMICRGPYTIRGYYKAEEHNGRVFDSEGFYWTGDVVRLDGDGNVIIEGRTKDLINRGGEKISAEEVEGLLIDHPKIRSIAVVPMPDPDLGEKACAYVIGREGEEVTLRDLITHLEEKKIAKFKFPERLEIMDAFPYTNVGKVSKKALQEDIRGKLAREKD